MKTYNAEVIGVGTELLLGQIANTNAQFISEQLAKTGISTYYHQVVGDNLARVKDCFAQAANRSDFVFVTGGLGPTEDDLTREAFQDLTGKQLEENQQIVDEILSYFKKTNRKMAANNRKQAQVFTDALIIPNYVGTAPGMLVSYQQTVFIFMPGVPKEMKAMMTKFVIPYLKENYQLEDLIKSRMLKFIGISESQLETDVKVLIDKQANPTIAPLASDGEVALRITAKAENEIIANQLIEEAEAEIIEKVGRYFYGYDDTTINEIVLLTLQQNNLTLAVAESLTGGLFADAFVSTPGASQTFKGGIVSYAEEAKIGVLSVSEQTIKAEGTVSEACAYEMAKQASIKFDASVGISFTGVAGPNETEGKEVGTVIISIYQKDGKAMTKSFYFPGERNVIRNRSVKKGLELLYYWLKQL